MTRSVNKIKLEQKQRTKIVKQTLKHFLFISISHIKSRLLDGSEYEKASKKFKTHLEYYDR